MKQLFSKQLIPVWVLVFVFCLVIGIGGFFLGGNLTALTAVQEQPATPTSTQAATPTTAAPTPTEPVTQAPQVQTAKLVSCGDLMCEYPLNVACFDYETQTFDFAPCFTYVKDLLSSGDFTAANLECVLDGSTQPVESYNDFGYIRLLAPDDFLTASVNAGFDLLTTANNHANDAGLAGMQRTLRALENHGIAYTGTRADEEAPPYVIKDVNGIRFGFIAYTYEGETVQTSLNGNDLEYGSEPLFNYFNETDPGEEFYNEMEARVQACRGEGADAVVVYIHWGIEFTYEASEYQVAIAQALADMDVDLIVGCHPHVVQPMAVYTSSTSGKKVPVMYSLGSIMSSMGEDDAYVNCEDGVVLFTHFTKDEQGTRLTTVGAVPIWICNYTQGDQEYFRAMPVTAEMDESQYCLADAENGVERAEASFARTMGIIGDGYRELRTLFP